MDLEISTESSVLSEVPNKSFHGEIGPRKPAQEALEFFYIDSDEEREVSYSVEHANQLDVSKDCVTIPWKGKEREIDLDPVGQNWSSMRGARQV